MSLDQTQTAPDDAPDNAPHDAVHGADEQIRSRVTMRDLRPMSDVPIELRKSRREILVRFKPHAFPEDSRWCQYNDRWVCVRHEPYIESRTDHALDLCWSMPGFGGLPDRYFAGWIELES